jgi:hypothetical protein
MTAMADILQQLRDVQEMATNIEVNPGTTSHVDVARQVAYLAAAVEALAVSGTVITPVARVGVGG